MKVLGLIPARGGSKGVPGKNFRKINGKPLIEYSIDIAKKSRFISEIVVTSDCKDILDFAKLKSCITHNRSKINSSDNAKINNTITEVLNYLNLKFDLVLLLQPTAPIREVDDLDNVIKKFINNSNLNSIVSVVELEDIHPARMYEIDKARNTLKSLNQDMQYELRQNLPKVYLRNGSIYAFKVDYFLSNNKLWDNNTQPYIMDESKWANIDTERDFIFTELMLKKFYKNH